MGSRAVIPQPLSKKASIVRKVTELVSEHGEMVEELINSGQIPFSQIGNFYGRHADRQEAILRGMQRGYSYSRAETQSKNCFDTKRWAKIPMRASSCRGLILKTAAGLASWKHCEQWPDDDIRQIEEISRAIVEEAWKLMHVLAGCEISSSNGGAVKRGKVETCQVGEFQPTFTCVMSRLKTARTKLRKCVRDVPRIHAKVGELSTVDDVAKTAIESARIIRGVPILMRVARGQSTMPASRRKSRDSDAVGSEYATFLTDYLYCGDNMKRIAIHRRPDADALVSAWIAERYLFSDNECQVEFVSRDFDPDSHHSFVAILDLGRMHDPSRRIFDHKPPAFSQRDEECATTLIWKHAQSTGCQVDHLEGLIELVHDGDAATRRSRSQAYRLSQSHGLHAIIKSARSYSQSDSMLYHGIAQYLDALFVSANNSAETWA